MKPSETSGGFFLQKSFVFLWRIEKHFYLWDMNNTKTHTMKVFTITISNEITGRVDHLECPTKADRSRIAGEYIRTLSKYPGFIHANSFLTQTIVSFADGKRVTLNFGSR